MNVYPVEYRDDTDDSDVLIHIASSWENVEAWIKAHPHLRRETYWFWVSEEEVDGKCSSGEARIYDAHGVHVDEVPDEQVYDDMQVVVDAAIEAVKPYLSEQPHNAGAHDKPYQKSDEA